MSQMKIEILGKNEALVYTPQERTYGIRIGFNGERQSDCDEFERLERLSLYVPKFYAFDDTEPWMKEVGEVPLSRETAISIISDFRNYSDGCSNLLVHCCLGIGRSPAVAVVLNEIFELGARSDEIVKRFPKLNIHVARTLLEVAQEQGLLHGRKNEN